MTRVRPLLPLLVLLAAGAAAGDPPVPAAVPGEAYLALRLDQVDFPEGDSVPLDRAFGAFELRGGRAPRVQVEGAAEAYLGMPWREPWGGNDLQLREMELGLRVDPGQGALHGVLWLVEGADAEAHPHPFTVAVGGAGPEGKSGFLRAEALHYTWLAARDLPGAAWFRHRADAARHALAQEGVEDWPFDPEGRLSEGRRRANEIDRTYALFSGGQALAENLALDSLVQLSDAEGGWIPIGEVSGVTVREMVYPAVGPDEAPVELDPLAALVPHDQHALFFPTFDALVRVVDEVKRRGTPVLELLDASAQDAHTQERYERQLCLTLDAAVRAFGGALIDSVAITGGDPYLRTGSDVTLILRSKQPALLVAFLAERHLEAQERFGAAPERRTILGVEVEGVRTPDRAISSFIARHGDDVLVSNSIDGLTRVLEAARGERKSLASTPELAYFRERYRRGEREDMFLVVSDPTIRRWCGPEWRIGSSRRVRAAAVLADQHARDLEARLAGAELAPGVVADVVPVPGAGGMRRTERGLLTNGYGGERFQTPIVELDVSRVTRAEREGYDRFRTEYERRWSTVFDPIGARLTVEPDGLELDLSIVPLVVRSDYRELLELSRGATLSPTAGDPHDGAQVHFALALGRESWIFRESAGFARSIAPGIADPLAWVGPDVSLWYDEDPELYDEVLATGGRADRLLEEFGPRLPLGFRIASTDPLRLAGFLTALRSMLESSAPGLVRFEAREHAGRGYVAILPEDLRSMLQTPLEVFYATFSDSFVVSLREDVVQRAIDRDLARRAGRTADEVQPMWLGESAGLRLGEGFQKLLAVLVGDEWSRERRELAWRALPILDEWRRLGVADPLAFHADEWGVTLRCPGGGAFVWNDAVGGFASTTFGHPAAPQPGPRLPQAVEELRTVDMGLSFVDGGVRARVRLR